MTWFKVDDGFAGHPKIDALLKHPRGLEALGVWVVMGSWCARNLTNGHVPTPSLLPVAGKKSRSLAGVLVEFGLWEVRDNGWVYRDWTVYQPTREHVHSERAKAAERKRKSRDTKRGGDSNVTPPVTRDMGVTATHASHFPDPTRPDPINDHETDLDPVEAAPPDTEVRARSFNPNEPGGVSPRVRSALVRGYQSRYERAFGDAWLSAPKAAADVDVVARWCTAGPEPERLSRVERVLDGAFADPWLVERRVPWGPIAKDPAKYAGGPAGKPGSKPKPSVDSYHPVRDGEPVGLTMAHDRVWNAWVRDGCPRDLTWLPPWKRSKVST